MKTLQIIQSAYRATIEEQDDTIVWITRVFQNAGTDVSVLLRGNAVNYAVRGQSSAGLSIGAWQQKNPPRVIDDLAALMENGAALYALAEDVDERGIAPDRLLDGIRTLSGAELPGLFEQHDRIWAW